MTGTEIDRLVQAFEDCTLPRAEWHHSQHLIVSLYCLATLAEAEAVERIRTGIQNYNRSQGIAMTPEGGYHETLTRFWIEVIKRFLAAGPAGRALPELAAELLARYTDKYFPLRYYSRELLNSWEARQAWVEPDLKSLDEEE